jgi:hypothetical protein
MAKHTLGPWTLNVAVGDDNQLDAQEHERYVITDEVNPVLIADCYPDTALELWLPDSFSEAQANARLIATAPKLYYALVKLCAASTTINREQLPGALEAAYEALNQATGCFKAACRKYAQRRGIY